MTAKDKAIINANPKLTPYDLHTQQGLSQAGFNELVASSDNVTQNALQASTPRLSPNAQAAIPLLSQPLTTYDGNEQVTLVGLKGGGNGTLMSRTLAEKQVRKYPQDYKII